MKKEMFDIADIYGYLGEFYEQYDIDGIVDEVTYMDYSTANRFWTDLDAKEFYDACERHYIA